MKFTYEEIERRIANSKEEEERKTWVRFLEVCKKRPKRLEFAFEYVEAIKRKCGHYEILQSAHPWNDEQKKLMETAETNCTMCWFKQENPEIYEQIMRRRK
jgi:hypothetical protein